MINDTFHLIQNNSGPQKDRNSKLSDMDIASTFFTVQPNFETAAIRGSYYPKICIQNK